MSNSKVDPSFLQFLVQALRQGTMQPQPPGAVGTGINGAMPPQMMGPPQESDILRLGSAGKVRG